MERTSISLKLHSLAESSLPHSHEKLVTTNDANAKLQTTTCAVGKHSNLKEKLKSHHLRLCWKEAARKVLHLHDPWEDFHMEKLETETVTRYRYNVLRQNWVKDEIFVKISKEPFSCGAMRACYRLKKLSKNSHGQNWRTTSNYVAKHYIGDVNNEVYFEDVKLQMDAKLWGEEYNRHNPPKKVDICQMSVIEFINRPDKPLFHLEHFIEGDYIKYNSNSGFISCENLRLTPQAFSHFTFERSGHELIVVDIQGVGDLYTDPQIHTATWNGYGDGNLGTKGMALFFHSHVCNSICKSLELSEFDLAPEEQQLNNKLASLQMSCKTQVRGTEDICISPSAYERNHLREFLQSRSSSLSSSSPSPSFSDEFMFTCHHHPNGYNPDIYGSPCSCSKDEEDEVDNCYGIEYGSDSEEQYESEEGNSFPLLPPYKSDLGGTFLQRTRRQRYDSENSFIDEKELTAFQEKVARKSRSSCVKHEIHMRNMEDDETRKINGNSVLGQIHLDMAKYHELGKFAKCGENCYDYSAALFHLEHSAKCGNVEALLCIASIYLHLPHDLLIDVCVPENLCNQDIGFTYMEQAAQTGSKSARIFIARAYDTGENLPSTRLRSWKEAIFWYNAAAMTDDEDEGGEFDSCTDDPVYKLLACQAELFKQGGFGLERDYLKAGQLYYKAAESAMSCMKGKLAHDYYMLAESVENMDMFNPERNNY